MASADGDGRGDDVALSEAALASLLDRSRVHEGDLVIGADAGGRGGLIYLSMFVRCTACFEMRWRK